jgi:hypothetical protein
MRSWRRSPANRTPAAPQAPGRGLRSGCASAPGRLGQDRAHEGALVAQHAAALVPDAVGLDEVRIGAEPAAVLLVGGQAGKAEQGQGLVAGSLGRQEVAVMDAAVRADQLDPPGGRYPGSARAPAAAWPPAGLGWLVTTRRAGNDPLVLTIPALARGEQEVSPAYLPAACRPASGPGAAPAIPPGGPCPARPPPCPPAGCRSRAARPRRHAGRPARPRRSAGGHSRCPRP